MFMTQVKNLINKLTLGLLALAMLFGVTGAGSVSTFAVDNNNTNKTTTAGGTIGVCQFNPTAPGCSDTLDDEGNTGVGGVLGFIFEIVQILIYIVGGIAVLFLVYGGFLFIVDPGGSGDGAKKGKQIIFNALIGLAIVLLATAIVQVVSSVVGGLTF